MNRRNILSIIRLFWSDELEKRGLNKYLNRNKNEENRMYNYGLGRNGS